MITGCALFVAGAMLAFSQVPTLHPDLRVFGLGLLLALMGGLLLSDRPRGR